MEEILLDGPGKNCLSTALMEKTIAQIDAARGAPLFFTGAGDAFCAGLDLREVASLDAAGMERYLLLVERLMTRVFEHPGPTIAFANGHAIAGGCVLLLACDMRIAKDYERIKIGVNEVALGLVYPPRIFQIVTHRVPPRARHEVILGAGLVPPREALKLGIIDRVGDSAEARSVAEHFAKLPTAAYATAKAQLRREVPAISDADQLQEIRAMVGTWTSSEIRNAVARRLSR